MLLQWRRIGWWGKCLGRDEVWLVIMTAPGTSRLRVLAVVFLARSLTHWPQCSIVRQALVSSCVHLSALYAVSWHTRSLGFRADVDVAVLYHHMPIPDVDTFTFVRLPLLRLVDRPLAAKPRTELTRPCRKCVRRTLASGDKNTCWSGTHV